MALADVIATVEAQLAADGVGVAVTSRLGAEHAARLDSYPPLLVWIPTSDEFLVHQARHPAVPRQKRMYFLRRAGVELHLWAKGSADPAVDPYHDLKALELLVDRVLVAIHHVSHGSVSVKGGSFKPGALDTLGRAYVLELSFDLPVVPNSPEATAVTLTTVQGGSTLTSTMDFPASDVTGVPAP